jgi:transposase-like protein
LPLRLEDRALTRAFWRSHCEVWRLSGQTQRDYCEQHGLSLKSFGNWRAQLKREDAAGSDARWGRYPRLRPSSRPKPGPRTRRAEPSVVGPKTPTCDALALGPASTSGGRREFSADAKRRIVEETQMPGATVSGVARRYKITTSLLFRWRQALGLEPPATSAKFLPVRIAEDGELAATPAGPTATPPSIIIERETAGIEVQLIGGRRVRFDVGVDPQTMRAVVLALEAGSDLP